MDTNYLIFVGSFVAFIICFGLYAKHYDKIHSDKE